MQDLYTFLKQREIIKDTTTNIQALFQSGKMIKGYIGTDPTAPSLHVGHLAFIMLLKIFQKFGNKPYALVGGATGMIGDPSFKVAERQFLSEDALRYNQECIKNQLSKFLDFSDCIKNKAELINNMDWYKDMNLISFLREAGKHITVNYMESKESVKRRITDGISFTEFSYQLLQSYDFYHLHAKYGVELQMGGSDQWGNITTGIELIRRKTGQTVHGLTIPLITKADGTKFGKSEGNCVWLDPNMTSPYDFYQFWINCSDDDVERLIYVFTLLSNEEIEVLKRQHHERPADRILQKTIARELTIMVHGEEEFRKAEITAKLLFGNATLEEIKNLEEKDFMNFCNSLPKTEMDKNMFLENKNAFDVIANNCIPGLFSSRGDVKRAIQEHSVLVNKHKIDVLSGCDIEELLFDKYILVQRGNKKYYIIIIR